MTKAHSYLKKAERSFRAAEFLLKQGDADFAASRVYYGYFYIAHALLLVHGAPQVSRHGQLLAQYGLQFAKTQRLDPRFHQLLIRAFKTREMSDYEVEEEVETEIVEVLISGGLEFLAAATKYIEEVKDGVP